jgi:hypothetical protein
MKSPKLKPVRHYVTGMEMCEESDGVERLSPVTIGPFIGRRGAERLVAGKGMDAMAHPELVGTGRIVTAEELKSANESRYGK